jgi:hypothetical protein
MALATFRNTVRDIPNASDNIFAADNLLFTLFNVSNEFSLNAANVFPKTPPLCVLPLDFRCVFLDLYALLFAKRLAERFTARLVALRRFDIVSMYILYGYNNGMEWNRMKWNGFRIG